MDGLEWFINGEYIFDVKDLKTYQQTRDILRAYYRQHELHRDHYGCCEAELDRKEDEATWYPVL